MKNAETLTRHNLSCLYPRSKDFYEHPQPSVHFSTLEFLKVIDNQWDEAVSFMENNLIPQLEDAVASRDISSFMLFSMPWEAGSRYNFVLRTDFSSNWHFLLSKKNHQLLTKNHPFLSVTTKVTRYLI